MPATHRIFINTTLPVMQRYTEDEVVDFLNRNRDKLTCINVSRHLFRYVEEGNDEIFARLEMPTRVNCVLFGDHSPERLLPFVRRFGAYRVPIQFRRTKPRSRGKNTTRKPGTTILETSKLRAHSILGARRTACN